MIQKMLMFKMLIVLMFKSMKRGILTEQFRTHGISHSMNNSFLSFQHKQEMWAKSKSEQLSSTLTTSFHEDKGLRSYYGRLSYNISCNFTIAWCNFQFLGRGPSLLYLSN